MYMYISSIHFESTNSIRCNSMQSIRFSLIHFRQASSSCHEGSTSACGNIGAIRWFRISEVNRIELCCIELSRMSLYAYIYTHIHIRKQKMELKIICMYINSIHFDSINSIRCNSMQSIRVSSIHFRQASSSRHEGWASACGNTVAIRWFRISGMNCIEWS